MTTRHGFIAAAATALFATSTAFAQAPAAPAAAPADQPKPKCEAPGDYPSKLASDLQRQRWGKQRDTYLACMKTFVTEQQALAEPHIKAANAAIAEFNEAVKRFNAQMESPN